MTELASYIGSKYLCQIEHQSPHKPGYDTTCVKKFLRCLLVECKMKFSITTVLLYRPMICLFNIKVTTCDLHVASAHQLAELLQNDSTAIR